MCRLYLSKGSVNLSKALKFAARYDPYAPSEKKQHGDGWGFVAATRLSFMYYKSAAPAWDDPIPVPMWEAVLAHARAASIGEPLGAEHAHPYAVHLPNGGIIFVAHNGSVDKYSLAAEVGIDPNRHTDSYVLALYLARHWDDLEKALDNVANLYMKTALNVVILEYPSLRAFAYSRYKGNRNYYALYILNAKYYTAVVSSTLLQILGRGGRGVGARRVTDFLRRRNRRCRGYRLYIREA
ncbi:putative glutamine amidotransferase [Pyrobaculum oguniense TE7]|uniref:Glutamine amidotransferase n=1 Tax=Pyrobaculum oguniense (strain DSM 13380 / JCM 10595 / TE7) TaxID=698757 RepID=H6Q6S1_PYROT|nr:putative glutamine amidotransferase [Pyrobaculum oguniense TE7]